jgi:hypothetical protein
MKLSELKLKYPNGELSSQEGDLELRYREFAPILKNLEGKKAVYHERYSRIITIQEILILPTYFKATATLDTIIEGTGRVIREIKKWEFGSNFSLLKISKNSFTPYAGMWELWIDEDIVAEVERLTIEKNFKEAIKLLHDLNRHDNRA